MVYINAKETLLKITNEINFKYAYWTKSLGFFFPKTSITEWFQKLGTKSRFSCFRPMGKNYFKVYAYVFLVIAFSLSLEPFTFEECPWSCLDHILNLNFYNFFPTLFFKMPWALTHITGLTESSQSAFEIIFWLFVTNLSLPALSNNFKCNKEMWLLLHVTIHIQKWIRIIISITNYIFSIQEIL